MKSPTAIKNQRAIKVKNTHMKSIMNEVKNKSIMEQLYVNEKCNEFDIQSFNLNKKQRNSARILRRNANPQKQNQALNNNKNMSCQQRVEQISQQRKTGSQKQEDIHIINHLIKPITRKQRKSSKIQLQLNQIIKYSSMYPSRINSQNSIQKSLEKLKSQRNKSIKTLQRSIFCAQDKQIPIIKNKKRNKIKFSKFSNFVKDENMFLNLIQPSAVLQSFDFNKQHHTRYLLKKSKNILERNKIRDDFSFANFIENQHTNLKIKKQRKTAFVKSSNQDFQSYKASDIRMENMQKIHQIFRGNCRNDEQISGYITTQQVNKFNNKYQTYKNIYKRSKQGFNSEKLDLNLMTDLTVKNAVFLNQALMQSNNRSRKLEIESTMRKLHFYN